ncbi:unnamed protein product [Meloidogyne enterolobii]|uniref:Uncharacterized protein n=1 Tax=Meloidogyne enterolobii TaxID=390850 RepID=A0ACB1AHI1_MELEN
MGFFRRTILRNQKFTCRFDKNCIIDKNFRCACRYCRFQKCLRFLIIFKVFFVCLN